MGDQLFNLFGDIITKPINYTRQQLFNDENRGKIGLTGPIKPNEPVKKAGDAKKKTFLSNTGVALQSTPAPKALSQFSSIIRSQTFTPKVYNDADDKNNDKRLCEKMEFYSPPDIYRYNNLQRDLIDCFFLESSPVPMYLLNKESPESPILDKESPESPILDTCERNLEYDVSYDDDFFLDDFNDSLPYLDDDLPDLF